MEGCLLPLLPFPLPQKISTLLAEKFVFPGDIMYHSRGYVNMSDKQGLQGIQEKRTYGIKKLIDRIRLLQQYWFILPNTQRAQNRAKRIYALSIRVERSLHMV